MKTTYRCTFLFTEDKYKDTPASNIFIRAENKELAIRYSKELFQKTLKENGIGNAKFNQEVRESSDTEAEDYKKNMSSGKNISRMIN